MFTINGRAIRKYKGGTILENNDPETSAILARFSDGNSVSEWARGYVAANIKLGIVNGSSTEDGMKLYPANAIIRAEVAVVLDKTMKTEFK